MKKRIIFNLKREWYDKIASGEKTVEYRKVNNHWISRLTFTEFTKEFARKEGRYLWSIEACKWPEVEAIFRLGYSRKYPDIVRRVTKIDIGTCPYDGWEGEYFRIYFEKLASDITPSDLVKQPDEIMREDRRAEHSEEI